CGQVLTHANHRKRVSTIEVLVVDDEMGTTSLCDGRELQYPFLSSSSRNTGRISATDTDRIEVIVVQGRDLIVADVWQVDNTSLERDLVYFVHAPPIGFGVVHQCHENFIQ